MLCVPGRSNLYKLAASHGLGGGGVRVEVTVQVADWQSGLVGGGGGADAVDYWQCYP